MSIYSTAVKQFIWVREDNIIGLKLKVFSFCAINIGQELSQILSGVFGRSGSEVIRAFSGALAVKGLIYKHPLNRLIPRITVIST